MVDYLLFPGMIENAIKSLMENIVSAFMGNDTDGDF
jgi:hypothetical protein